MRLLEDVIKKKKFYQILSITLLSLDIIFYVTLESLDIGYTLPTDKDYDLKLSFYIIKIIIMIVFVGFLIFSLVFGLIKALMMSAITYLAIGIVLFCYLLIDELKALSNPQQARPKNYFIYNIYTIIILLNIFTAFFRIIGGIVIFFYITILKIVKRREEYEREERLMAIENNSNQDYYDYINDQSNEFNIKDKVKVSNSSRTKIIPQENEKKKNNNSVGKQRINPQLIEYDELNVNERIVEEKLPGNLIHRV